MALIDLIVNRNLKLTVSAIIRPLLSIDSNKRTF